MSKILFFMFVVGCFIPATLMAKVEKVTLESLSGHLAHILMISTRL